MGAEVAVMETITCLNLERDIIMLPRLHVTELPFLFSAATALVFPSLFEGGGIPVIEAMACGCPVIAANIPVVQEFAGDAASYFDPLDVSSIGKAMIAFQNDAKTRDLNRQTGLARAAEFKPRKVVGKLLNAYGKLLKS
jgi:glycosyltransferase involved in cell wall biosynthesis